jgi:hypothetical protein
MEAGSFRNHNPPNENVMNTWLSAVALVAIFGVHSAVAEDSDAEIAKKLSNPVSDGPSGAPDWGLRFVVTLVLPEDGGHGVPHEVPISKK